MFVTSRVKATIIEDDSGIKSQLPIILTEQGELGSVTDYLLKMEANGKSMSSLNKVVQVARLLIEYMSVNKNNFSDPKYLFQTFTKRLYSGTIGEDGLDPSGLYWVPSSTASVDQLIVALTGLTDFLAEKQSIPQMNPLTEAGVYSQWLNYMAWHRKNQHDFLGHIKDKSQHSTIRKARRIKGRNKLTPTNDDAIAFPETRFKEFFRDGIGGANDPRVALRDKLIVLLMHGAGLRKSEAMTLWVHDVLEDPFESFSMNSNDPAKALVRIYNEEDGVAPGNWRSKKGTITRKAYLLEEYGLIPRSKRIDTKRVGWKGRIVDHKDNYIQVQWFPSDYGKLFMILWQDYLKYRASIDCHHPYAFISFHPQYLGNPYTINAFHTNYENGLRRIGLTSNKRVGHDPHGHRHSYGRRLEASGLNPLVIKKCMHHKSLESQVRYTTKNQEDISNILNEATKQLSNLDSIVKPLNWKDLIKHGFDDIEPDGYFTGEYPKLRNR